jgi:hypothetical protein
VFAYRHILESSLIQINRSRGGRWLRNAAKHPCSCATDEALRRRHTPLSRSSSNKLRDAIPRAFPPIETCSSLTPGGVVALIQCKSADRNIDGADQALLMPGFGSDHRLGL